jgi:hypothetical protein
MAERQEFSAFDMAERQEFSFGLDDFVVDRIKALNGSPLPSHGIAKDAKHPTILSKQAKEAREQCKKRALDAGMSEPDSKQFAPR